jgi:hypothetical protein
MATMLSQVQDPAGTGSKFGGSLPVIVLAVVITVLLGHLRRPATSRRSVLALIIALGGPFFMFLGYFVNAMSGTPGPMGCMGVASIILFVPAAVILALLGLRDLRRNPKEFQSGKIHAFIALGLSAATLLITVIILATSK